MEEKTTKTADGSLTFNRKNLSRYRRSIPGQNAYLPPPSAGTLPSFSSMVRKALDSNRDRIINSERRR